MILNWFTALAETGEVATATAAEGAPAQSSGMIEMLVMIVIMIAVMYFLMIRPQRKKEKQVKNMLSALKPGDKISTIGGFYGTIVAVKEDTVTISLGSLQNNVVIAKGAVKRVEDSPLENDAEPEI